MHTFTNGMSASAIQGAVWIKAVASSEIGNCVELAALPTGQTAVRNSTDPEGAALVFTAAEIAAFVDGAKRGEFDHLCAA